MHSTDLLSVLQLHFKQFQTLHLCPRKLPCILDKIRRAKEASLTHAASLSTVYFLYYYELLLFRKDIRLDEVATQEGAGPTFGEPVGQFISQH